MSANENVLRRIERKLTDAIRRADTPVNEIRLLATQRAQVVALIEECR